jgi:hypothetical protein
MIKRPVTQIAKARFEPVPVKLTVNGQVCTIIAESCSRHKPRATRRSNWRSPSLCNLHPGAMG